MAETALTPGALIAGRYRLEHLLGEGGMGVVWAATHTVTRRSVAMKFLREAIREKAEIRQRFLREATAASALRHPHVVEVLDVFDFEERSPVMVMELLVGETLGKKLSRDERLSLEETAALLLPVISAVGSAHALGVVHRDLKPENVFLVREERGDNVKVLDFGVAKLTAEHFLERDRSALVTDTGSMLGTPCYMAPEQATGELLVDHRADVWSIGVLLYECLSGTRPIEGETLPQVVARLLGAGIIPLERIAPELPPDVTALVRQMLTREPGKRPQDLNEVLGVLYRHSTVRVPAFGPPHAGPPSVAPEARRPRARVVTSRDADPQGATMLSTPATGRSVAIEGGPARPPARRTLWIALTSALAAVGLTVVALFALGALGAGPATTASALTPLPTPAVTPATAVGTRSDRSEDAPPVTMGDTGSSEGAPSGAPPATLAQGSLPAAKASRKRPAPPAAPKRTTPLSPKQVGDDDSLFPGRK